MGAGGAVFIGGALKRVQACPERVQTGLVAVRVVDRVRNAVVLRSERSGDCVLNAAVIASDAAAEVPVIASAAEVPVIASAGVVPVVASDGQGLGLDKRLH